MKLIRVVIQIVQILYYFTHARVFNFSPLVIKNKLKSTFKSICHHLAPLTEEQQVEFFINFWTKHDAFGKNRFLKTISRKQCSLYVKIFFKNFRSSIGNEFQIHAFVEIPMLGNMFIRQYFLPFCYNVGDTNQSEKAIAEAYFPSFRNALEVKFSTGSTLHSRS